MMDVDFRTNSGGGVAAPLLRNSGEREQVAPASARRDREHVEPLAIVAGVRTPFAKAFGPLESRSADELGRIAVEGVLQRAGMRPDQVGEVVFGNVAGPADASNVSRVIALRAGIPQDRVAHTVNRNCASGMEAVLSAWQVLREGRADVAIAGGAESMSNVPFLWDVRAQKLLIELAQAKSWTKKLKVLTKFRPGMFKPVPGLQLGLTDPTCGLNMGQTAEKIAREFSITREAQDRFALESHRRAVAAWERGFFQGEVVPVPDDGKGHPAVERDVGPRAGQTFEALAKLRPYFEQDGTVTVGNSCPITDGAAALILMPASRAESQSLEPLGYVRDYAVAGCDPSRMGLGPVYAMHKLLTKSKLKLADFDLFEINEAFAAQVLSCQTASASDAFAQRELGRAAALGEIPADRLNVNGGAIALGHPVGTTGARLIMTLMRALREKQLKRGLASLCVGGGQGVAVWVEVA